MRKKIIKIGNSHGIVFDSSLMELARLKIGDELDLELHSGGAITLLRVEPDTIDPERASETARRLIGKNGELFRRLS